MQFMQTVMLKRDEFENDEILEHGLQMKSDYFILDLLCSELIFLRSPI